MSSCLRRKFRAIFLALAIADSIRQQGLASRGPSPAPVDPSPWPLALVATAQCLIRGEPISISTSTSTASSWTAGSTAGIAAMALLHQLPQLLLPLDAETSLPPAGPDPSSPGQSNSPDAEPGEIIRLRRWLHQTLFLAESAAGGKGDVPLPKPTGSMAEWIKQPSPSVVVMAAQVISYTRGQLGLALPLGLRTGRGQEAGSLELIAVMSAALGGYSSLPLGWQWTYLQAPAAAASFSQRWGLGQMAELLAIADGLYSRWAGMTPARVIRQAQDTEAAGLSPLPLAIPPGPSPHP